MVTPRVHFCWLCGKKLRGDSHLQREVDGHTRILHLICSESLDAEVKIASAAFDDESDDGPLRGTDYLEDYRDDDE